MRPLFAKFSFAKFLGIALLLTSLAHAQSLGDVARENREKKASEDNAATPPKVITNKDLPKNTDEDQPAVEDTSKPNADDSAATADRRRSEWRAAHRSLQQQAAEQRAANQWKRQILEQKNRVAALQARIDEVNAEMRSFYGSTQYEPQAKQMLRISRLQQQLDEQRIRLAQIQESARRAGMHTTVYDP